MIVYDAEDMLAGVVVHKCMRAFGIEPSATLSDWTRGRLAAIIAAAGPKFLLAKDPIPPAALEQTLA